ncbi:hypothetical protein DRJ25_06375 [Candidatus Woesearchaeota archaeon]|nr:MAG: hypothetical protein DRJ25_06375 [Candidatus Woesearchaeota archaeon]
MDLKKVKGICLAALFLFFMSGLMSLLVTGKVNWPLTFISIIGFAAIIFLVLRFQKAYSH